MNIALIRQAAQRISPYAHRTPVLTSRFLDDHSGGSIYFKCENLQKVGAFKFRGACNAVFSLSEAEAQRGVTTHSSGNHGQAVALAAKLRGVDATVVMPRTASSIKRKAVEGYGATIIDCDPTQESRESTAAAVIDQTGAVLIHPFDDDRVIAGQGTAALELIEDAGPLDMVMAPVGGGGLLGGTATTTSALCPNARVIGTEPEGADDAYRSLQAGKMIPSVNPVTLADGLLTSLGDRTFPIIQRYVSAIVTVGEVAIVEAMRTVWQRMKIIIEPSAAVPVAALLEGKVNASGQRVGVVLSGGNVDLDHLPWQ